MDSPCHPLWKLCIEKPLLKNDVLYIMKLAVTMRNQSDILLCHKCGQLHKDTAIHIVLDCTFVSKLRDSLWCNIININDIMFSVYLHSLDNYGLFHVLLGGQFDFNLPPGDMDQFRSLCVKAIKLMIHVDKYYT